MKKISLLLILLLSSFSFAQLKGIVTDNQNNPIAFANIYVKNTFISTTTNDKGYFELNFKTVGNYTVLFQYLGYKTEKRELTIDRETQNITVILQEENIEMNEIVVSAKTNPAIEIMRNAIKFRKENSKQSERYKADFYSRGIFRIKDLPKKFLGEKIDEYDDILDSTRSGILYLSETVSKVTFQKPDKLKEEIIASKVSGNSNGFSFNTASQANFDFYENYIDFGNKLVSPIANNAFSYYDFKFEGSFFDENRLQINKIKLIPKRANDPAYGGYIYIVDDSWAIYAVDVSIDGKRANNPVMDLMEIKQNFSFNSSKNIWIKNTQSFDFKIKILAFKANGRFTHVYSNFEFPESFDKKTFSREVVSFQNNANTKDDAFWNTIRPVPLTEEESNDYLKKGLLQTKKESKPYLDSIDKKHNKFKIGSILMGYNYKNSFKKYNIQYDGPLLATTFNTVQGWNTNVGLFYNTTDEDKNLFSSIGRRVSYGFADKKIRGVASYTQKFNNFDKSTLTVFGGSSVSQFNPENPISNKVNMVASLFFKDNYMKLYEKNFAKATFKREIINGLFMNFGAEYAERKPLFNATDYTVLKYDKSYLSNNPLNPLDDTSPAFDKNNIVKLNVVADIKIGQKYYSRPNGKFNLGSSKFPLIQIGFEKGLSSTKSDLSYDFISTRITKEISAGDKGNFTFALMAGQFFNSTNISFVDYKHFNGNQTHIGNGQSYTNVFNLLPYYLASTNDKYLEFHAEHNDSGFLMNKIPLLNKLRSQLVLGVHNLAIPDRKPYQEFSIGLDNLGFGKYRIFRIDYLKSYQNGYLGDGFVFGIKLLDAIGN